MIVRVPGSSANLGPGFDALGLAVSLHAEIGLVGESPVPDRARLADDHHPATIAYRDAGGRGRLWVRSALPMGRGLGFSGAVRVGGAVAAVAERSTGGWQGNEEQLAHVLDVTSALEGHADNVAASLYGGVVATAAGRVVRVPLAIDPVLVAWVPSVTTSTDQSRGALPDAVPLDDVVFNIGRTALLVAALASGDTDALRVATQDRLHQDVRLAQRPESRAALQAALDTGAWGAWLSGSGPSVASLCAHDAVDELVAAMSAVATAGAQPASVKVLRIDHDGAVVEREALPG